MQINGTTTSYPLTFLQGILAHLGVMYTVLIAMIGFTLLLSSRMKSPYLVLIVVVPALFIPMFLPPSGYSDRPPGSLRRRRHRSRGADRPVCFPLPVAPIKATACPGSAVKLMSCCKFSPASGERKGTWRNSTEPVFSRSWVPFCMRTSVSSTSLIRWTDIITGQHH